MPHPGTAGRTSLSFRDALSSLIVANRSRFGAYAATKDHDRYETVALWGIVSQKLAASFLARKPAGRLGRGDCRPGNREYRAQQRGSSLADDPCRRTRAGGPGPAYGPRAPAGARAFIA